MPAAFSAGKGPAICRWERDRLDFAINLKTVTALGLIIKEALLAAADEVIQ
jgi:hypothetical protein